jgi:hypothetical protein
MRNVAGTVTALAALGLALGLVACGGGEEAGAVASLGGAATGQTATTTSTGDEE